MHAIIDVGSNSVRLMLGSGERTLSKSIATTRLGEGLAVTGRLSEKRIADTLEAINIFIDKAVIFGVSLENVFIFATESVRSASNGGDFVNAVYELSGIKIDVVGGELEAKLGFNGAYSGGAVAAVVDIGGASTEITVGDADGIIYSCSRPIGCVRIRDRCGEDEGAITEYVDDVISSYGDIPNVDRAVFVAGTASTVAMMCLEEDVYDASKVQDLYVTKDRLCELTAIVKNTPLSIRSNIKGLPEKRSDIIYGGMALVKAILERLGLDGFYFSDRDNLEGYRDHIRKEGRLKD